MTLALLSTQHSSLERINAKSALILLKSAALLDLVLIVALVTKGIFNLVLGEPFALSSAWISSGAILLFIDVAVLIYNVKTARRSSPLLTSTAAPPKKMKSWPMR